MSQYFESIHDFLPVLIFWKQLGSYQGPSRWQASVLTTMLSHFQTALFLRSSFDIKVKLLSLSLAWLIICFKSQHASIKYWNIISQEWPPFETIRSPISFIKAKCTCYNKCRDLWWTPHSTGFIFLREEIETERSSTFVWYPLMHQEVSGSNLGGYNERLFLGFLIYYINFNFSLSS